MHYFALLLLAFVVETSIIHLDKWDIYNADQSIHLVNQPTPSSVYMQLYANGKIGDPYWGTNDTATQWIGETDWTYEHVGDITDEIRKGKRIELVAEGIDTISQIFMNDKPVATTDNMFVRYTFDVTNTIRAQQDKFNIKVAIKSPISYGNHRSDNYPYVIPHIQYKEKKDRNQLRKKQCSYGWDWINSYIDSGIWQPIYLRVVQADDVQIEDMLPQVALSSSHWLITIDTTLLSLTPSSPTLQFTLSDKDGAIVDEKIQVKTNSYSSTHRHILSVPIDAVKRWYPNGYGDHPLYELRVTNGVDTKTRRVGFRAVELVRAVMPNKDVPFSKSFFFRVNGIPIFAKGANLVPFDAFDVRVTHERIDVMIQAALDANFNMLRVWGGEIYQDSYFYDRCDEEGILVWQEFMFACACYPRDPEFLQSVSDEVKTQVSRLIHHSSIILWSGNNEIESSLWDKTWYPDIITAQNKSRYIIDYSMLFEVTIRDNVQSVDQSRVYVPSSPGTGPVVDEVGWYVGNWAYTNGDFAGDNHWYIFDDALNVTRYPKSRFISEYGARAFTARRTMQTSTNSPQDFYFNSSLLVHRQTDDGEISYLVKQLEKYFTVTPKSFEYDTFTYLTQLFQNLIIKYMSEYFKSLKDSSSKTMGSLYWMFNDIWPAPTWGSVDYAGRYKYLHYTARRFYAPLTVNAYVIDNTTMRVFVSSDINKNIESITVDIRVFTYDGKLPVNVITKQVPMEALGSVMIFETKNIEQELLKGKRKQECIVSLSVRNYTNVHNEFFPSLWKDIVNLQHSEIKIMNVTKTAKGFDFNMWSEYVAPFVFVEIDAEIFGLFDDNAFTLWPSEMKKMSFECRRGNCDITAEEFSKLLVTRTLSTSY